MAYLLKVKPRCLVNGVAEVPKKNSALLTQREIGATVYVWLDDDGRVRGGLYARGILAEIDQIDMPQVRDPQQTKPGYRLGLAELSVDVISPLLTDELPTPDASDAPIGLWSLRKLRSNRHDKIILLSNEQVNELSSHFQR